jgi:tetratricopeptide (TPR) repeat protein/tRNA A-37 threonylcarbamoyl transferase component Bud32
MTTFQKQRLGKYILLDKLAVGGMAELHLAMITGVEGFEKLIAIKKILPHLATEEVLVKSFIDEAKLAALLHHQNIVQIYDFGSLGDTYFIAMEYLFGKDCRAVLRKAAEANLPLVLQHALLIVSRLCAGLDYAHKLKDFHGKPLHIIHRDISPQNILITYEGDVKIVDFGIAKAESQTTMTQMGLIKGKVAYMSPEQAAGKVIDHRSDIFSCGIILYEMVTGRRMFDGDTMQILAKVREAQFIRPEDIQTDLPQKLLSTLHRALAREPEQRYQSCGDMLTDLEECMQQMGLHPTANALARYMKTLFADEIAADELHMREISAIGLSQDGPAAQTAPLPQNDEATEPAIAVGPTGDAGVAPDSRHTGPAPPAHSRKSIYAAIIVAVLVVIALLATFTGRRQEAEQPLAETILDAGTTPATADGHPLELTTEPESLGAAAPDTELYQQAMDALVTGHFQQAIDGFETLLPLGPAMQDKIAAPYAEALAGQAEKLARTDVDKATELLEKSTHLDPQSEQAHFQLGMLYLRQKEYSLAMASFQNVIALDPQFADSYFNLGFIHAVAKDYAKAEAMYARVVELAPDYLDEALFNLALVQNEQGKKADSLANLEKAVAINPKNMSAQNYLKKLQDVSGEKQ